ncbi:MAG: hypothetical protein JW750_12230 [Anaerolineaceae bacterium]|nr:hypothetical protein [Anaerolineaceae bacterium]
MTAAFALQTLIFLPVITFPFIYLIGRGLLRLTRKAKVVRNPARWLAIAVLLAICYPLYIVVRHFLENGAFTIVLGTITLQMDGISMLLSVLVVLISLLIVIFSADYMAGDLGEEKYYALIVLMVGMIIGLGSATDLFNLWVWFEAMAITPYVLVSFYHDQPASLEAGVKYLIQSAAGTMMVLFGMMIIFLKTGSLLMSDIAAMNISDAPAFYAAGALFIIGFGVKIALVPMHTWLPDAHSQAPSGISALLSGIVIETGLIALLRVLGMISSVFNQAGIVLLIFAALNIFIGNMLALKQNEIKRMVAFSSISHVGYILLGIGITMHYGGINGAQGGFFHLFNHGIMKGLTFLAVGSLLFALRLAKGDHSPLVKEDLNGVAKRYPRIAVTLSIGLFALGGLPPFAGFMSKMQIFLAGFETHDPLAIGLVIFAAVNSVISLAYYTPLVNRMYRRHQSEVVLSGASISTGMKIPLTILMILTVILGFYPALLNWLTQPAAQALLDAFTH